MRPHPLFREFIKAALHEREKREGVSQTGGCPPCPSATA